jgi:hypothetical protein
MLDETVIPEGIYCYTIRKIEYQKDNGMPRIKLNLCPYWKYITSEDRVECTFCELMGIPYDGLLLDDQCKECGIKEEINEYQIKQKGISTYDC